MLSSLSNSLFQTDFQLDSFTGWGDISQISERPQLNSSENNQFSQKSSTQSVQTPQIDEIIFDVLNLDGYSLINDQNNMNSKQPEQKMSQKIHEMEFKDRVLLEYESTEPNQLPKINRRKYIKPEKKLFNNMPGFLISSIQALVNKIQFDSLETNDFVNMNNIYFCFDQIKRILMMLSSKLGNRKDLRMIFNDIDEKLNMNIKKSKSLSKADMEYLYLLESYPKQIINQAKKIFRIAVYRRMTDDWIFHRVESRKFFSKMQEKKEIFEKYLKYFREELFKKEISFSIDKKKVLSISLFHN